MITNGHAIVALTIPKITKCRIVYSELPWRFIIYHHGEGTGPQPMMNNMARDIKGRGDEGLSDEHAV